MQFTLGDSRTGRPFKIQKASRKEEAEYEDSLLKRLFARLGLRGNPNSKMKKIKVLQSAIISRKVRHKGYEMTLPNLKAAELEAMKIVSIEGDAPDEVREPWRKQMGLEKPKAQKGAVA